MPKELVYDQVILISMAENAGDLQLTPEFQKYVAQRKFNVHLCRKADSESKGKIENVVGYIKKNFAKHRVFTNVEKWNEHCMKWLERTGNANIHNTTKKRPAEVHLLEKEHLKPISLDETVHFNSSITRMIRKDNTIRFQSNRYSVPLGTYQSSREVIVYITVTKAVYFPSLKRRFVIRRPREYPPTRSATRSTAERPGVFQTGLIIGCISTPINSSNP